MSDAPPPPPSSPSLAEGEGGVLYVVATPIGHLGDITLRAIEVLRQCHRVAAEDTRRTRVLLTHLGITGKPVEALHAHSAPRDVARILRFLHEGERVACTTDAGTPVVSDPGDALIQGALEEGIPVVPIPGPSAVLTALVGSGLSNGAGFRFVGFLPREGSARRQSLSLVAATEEPVILFESPHRLHATLVDLAEIMPTRRACIARELTKRHEEYLRGTLAELSALDREWLGEIALVLGPYSAQLQEESITDEAIDRRIDEELQKGLHAKTVAEKVAAWSARPKRAIYERVVSRKARG